MSRLSENLRRRWEAVILDEIGRARRRVKDLVAANPEASPAELARRLTRAKQRLASATGAAAGLFGLATLPADLALVTYLELGLVVDIAILHGANLKTARAREEVLDVLDYASGEPSRVLRPLPRPARRFVQRFMDRALAVRAIPVVGAPVSAAYNHRSLRRVAETALRFYGTMNKLPPRKT